MSCSLQHWFQDSIKGIVGVYHLFWTDYRHQSTYMQVSAGDTMIVLYLAIFSILSTDIMQDFTVRAPSKSFCPFFLVSTLLSIPNHCVKKWGNMKILVSLPRLSLYWPINISWHVHLVLMTYLSFHCNINLCTVFLGKQQCLWTRPYLTLDSEEIDKLFKFAMFPLVSQTTEPAKLRPWK